MRGRFCRRGHALIPGKTAYTVTRWTGREMIMPEAGGWFFACDGGPLTGVSCLDGGTEEHRRLEAWSGARGTRVVGVLEDGRTLWQHREIELRCRACNRDRVARFRDKRKKAVMGSPAATNYTAM